MTASTFRTVLPPHVIRQAAHQRCAPHLPLSLWLEQQWQVFMRRNSIRRRNGDVHARFDRYLESLK